MKPIAPNKNGCKPDFDECIIHKKPLINRYGCDEQRPLRPRKEFKRRREPVEHDVYRRGDSGFRRVVAVRDGRVCYSTGGDRNRWCDLRTFLKWINGRTITLAHDGRQSPSA